MPSSLAPLNQTAALLMAAAVTELFPGALLVGGQGTSDRFFYDFEFPFDFQENFICMIEERMRMIIREKREIRLLEMVPSNASVMLRHHGQPLLAESVLELRRALVEMCQIGPFICYSPHPVLSEVTIPFFKLLEFSPLGKRGVRIVGAAATEKEELKRLAKQPSSSSRCHLKVGSELKMFTALDVEGHMIWHPRGELLRQRLIQWWKEEHVKQKFSFITSPAAFIGSGGEGSLTLAHKEYFFQFGTARLAEVALVSTPEKCDPTLGFLAPKAFFADRAHLFCLDEKLLEECISSLQFILTIPKILGFEYETVLTLSSDGPQKMRARAATLLKEALHSVGVAYTIEKGDCPGSLASVAICFADALGRRWTGPYLSIPAEPMPAGKGSMLIRSTFGSLERITALLLEHRGGWLPLSLAPEQVRILVVTEQSGDYAEQVCKRLQAEGLRTVVVSGDLNRRLYEAMKEKVPYVLLLGKKEAAAQTLTVRAHGESKEQILSLDEFCMQVKCEMGSETSEPTN